MSCFSEIVQKIQDARGAAKVAIFHRKVNQGLTLAVSLGNHIVVAAKATTNLESKIELTFR